LAYNSVDVGLDAVAHEHVLEMVEEVADRVFERPLCDAVVHAKQRLVDVDAHFHDQIRLLVVQSEQEGHRETTREHQLRFRLHLGHHVIAEELRQSDEGASGRMGPECVREGEQS